MTRWPTFRPLTLLPLLLRPALPLPQTYVTGTFTGAIYVTNPNLSAAVPAQCPADHPVSCTSLQEPDYCCQSGNYCAYTTNHVVGCCPNGQTCSGSIGGAGGYEPTSYYQSTWQPTTTYYQPTPAATTVYAGGGVVVPAGYATTNNGQYIQQTTAQQQTYYGGNGQYCSTLVAIGPGLPTTAAGGCGTILIESPPASAARRQQGAVRCTDLVVVVAALQGLGVMVFALR